MNSDVFILDARKVNETTPIMQGAVILIESDSMGLFLYLDTGYRIRIMNSALNKILSQEVLERLKGNANT